MSAVMELKVRNDRGTLKMKGALRKIEGLPDFGLMNRIAGILESGVQLRFRDEVDPQGKRWTPSARAIGQGGQTLQDTGDLKKDYVARVASNTAIEIGSAKEYSRIHDQGGKAGRNRSVTIPQRQVLGVSRSDANAVLRASQQHVRELLGG